MKHKILILVSLIVVLVGCSLTDSGIAPKRVVEEMLGNYQSLNSEVLNQLDKVIKLINEYELPLCIEEEVNNVNLQESWEAV